MHKYFNAERLSHLNVENEPRIYSVVVEGTHA